MKRNSRFSSCDLRFPYDRKRSRIAHDRKESCFHIIGDDRRADCNHTFRSAEMSNVLASCARGKIKANNMTDIEEEILLQANLFLLLAVPQQGEGPKETSVLDSKNIHEETR